VRGIACRQRLILRDTHAILIPIVLNALFAVALFILLTVYSRAPVRRLHVVPLVMLHPLSLITGLLIEP
jgi:hypothetical protein